MKTKFKVEFLTDDGCRVSETKVFEVDTTKLAVIDQNHVTRAAQDMVNLYAEENNYQEWRFDV